MTDEERDALLRVMAEDLGMLRRDIAMVRAAQQRQAEKLNTLTRDEETLARDTHAMRSELLADLPAALPGAVAAKVAELINPLRADVDVQKRTGGET